MKFTNRAILALLAAAQTAFVAAEDAIAPEDSAVVKLTEETFESFIAENPYVLAEFFAPWCGHCKRLGPEFASAADSLAAKHDNIKLAQIDCTEEQALCQKFGIRGYPTLKVFQSELEVANDYPGGRDAASISSYMIKLTLPAVQVVEDASDLDDSINENTDVIILQVLPEGVDSAPSNATFYELANRLRNEFTFISTSADKFVDQYSKSATKPSYVIFRGGESIEDASVYSGEELDETHLVEFIDIESKPLFGEINGATYQAYMSADIPLAYYFYNSPEEKEAAAPIVTKLAKANRGEINFVGLDATQFGQHAANLNMKEEFPLFVIHDLAANKKYGVSQESPLDNNAITQFVQQFKAGEIEPIVKSEPIPEVQENAVYKLVGKEHEDIIHSKKDVLVKYYAPWCGHCKKLAPTFEELAELYSSTDDVLIADLDHTVNDIDGVEIEGYPTIVLFPADGSEPVYYEGGKRDLESFVEFIKEKGSNNVDGFALEETTEAQQEEAAAEPVEEATPAPEEEIHDEL